MDSMVRLSLRSCCSTYDLSESLTLYPGSSGASKEETTQLTSVQPVPAEEPPDAEPPAPVSSLLIMTGCFSSIPLITFGSTSST